MGILCENYYIWVSENIADVDDVIIRHFHFELYQVGKNQREDTQYARDEKRLLHDMKITACKKIGELIPRKIGLFVPRFRRKIITFEGKFK